MTHPSRILGLLFALGLSSLSLHAGSLTGYWTFDDGGLEDSSGHSLNGDAPVVVEYSDDVPPTLGKGKSIVFDGSNRAIIPHGPSLDEGDALSVSFWMKADAAAQTDDYPAIIAKFGGFKSPGWYIGKHGESSIRWNESRPVPALDGTWHHLVFVYDGSTITAYCDGVPVGLGGEKFAEAKYHADIKTPAELVFGAREAGQHIRPFVGQLDDVAIFSRALARDEVEQIHGGLSPKDLP